MIEVKNVTKNYGKLTAIKDLSLKIGESSIYGLVGYNGAGKTTRLKTMIGMFKADQGKVLVDGENVFDNEEIRKSMFFVPDELYFLPQATIKDMAKFYKGFYPNWNDDIARKITDILKLDDSKRIIKFSKGMQRQTAILLGLSSMPKYLLLGELFDGLDPIIRNIMRKLLLEVISETQTTVVVSSHNLKELEHLCDHIGVINKQHIVYDNSIDNLRSAKFRCKAVFESQPNVKDFAAIKHSTLKINGKIASFIARESEQSIDEKLAVLKPLMVDKIPLGLEELFLDEMEVSDYDFSGIFS